MDAGALFAGTKSQGDVAARIKKIMDEVEKSGDIILFIDEIHNLVGGGSDAGSEISSVFSILEPHLSGGRTQFIGATNIQNYRKYIEPNGAFSRLFNIVELPPANKEESLEVLKRVTKRLENLNGITITTPALIKIIDLSEKLIHDRVLPDKAIDILNRTAVSIAKTTKYLTANDAAKEISVVTHVPVSALSEDESQKLLSIEEEMKKRVIGQDQAIIQIGGALKRARVGIRNEGKPIASFLFVGTTGVGKTETAKTLARTYFGSEKVMIRLDMSEYQQMDSINRLIGNPDGSSKGILTEAVRTSPFSLILLDEIEKAHSNILLTFLQVLDDGRLTDSSGRVIDFTNSIIIATSNVGTKAIQQIAERAGTFEEMQESAMRDVRDKFAPEFLNRFNGIIVFRPLTLDGVQKIANILLENVKKAAEAKGIKIFFKPELINELVKRGFSTQWGARPLARVIENSVESYLAVKILSNQLKMGDIIYLGLEVFDNNV
jgi:ATP-dependent Clp protease ATP-binding subunit ClpC